MLAIALLAGAALLLGGLAEHAAAAQLVGKDGRVYACYRVKGKQKGSVRLVAKRAHCRRGERKTQWAVAGSAGSQGTTGQAGATGGAGAIGATGASGLETRVTALTSKVEVLENTLEGVTNETLTQTLDAVNGITNAQLGGALSKLEGVTGTQLEETVASLADVSALCTRASSLTSQVNSVASALESTALGGIIPLGLELLVPGLPAALPAFSCP